MYEHIKVRVRDKYSYTVKGVHFKLTEIHYTQSERGMKTILYKSEEDKLKGTTEIVTFKFSSYTIPMFFIITFCSSNVVTLRT